MYCLVVVLWYAICHSGYSHEKALRELWNDFKFLKNGSSPLMATGIGGKVLRTNACEGYDRSTCLLKSYREWRSQAKAASLDITPQIPDSHNCTLIPRIHSSPSVRTS